MEEIQPQADLPLIIRANKSLKQKIAALCQSAANRMLVLSLCVPLVVCVF